MGHRWPGALQILKQGVLQGGEWGADSLRCDVAAKLSGCGGVDATGKYSWVDADENLNLNEVVLMVVGNKIDMEN